MIRLLRDLRLFREMRRTRHDYVEECIQMLIAEAELSSVRLSLLTAAFRLKQRAKDGGVFLTFDQALYRLRRRDRGEVFVRP